VSVALDRKVAYFAEHLSDNIAKTPEGYLICRNAVIGRTGFQTYRVAEIADPEGLLQENERNLRDDEELQLWRDPAEVFSRNTIASFEGKTFTLTHPDNLLDPSSEREHHAGHVQNVHRGEEPLDSGAYPLLADVLVTDSEAIRAIDAGERELSCGYTYRLAREGYRWEQRDIIGNHVALVPKGRAGEEAKIYDAAPEPKKELKVNIKQILSSWFKAAKPEEIEAALENKEVASILSGTRLAAVATDAVAAPKEKSVVVIGGKRLVSIGTTSDNVEVFKLVAKDSEPEEEKEKGKDGTEEENTAVMDRKKRMHDMLDRLLSDSDKEEAAKKELDDADMKSLKDMMDKFTGMAESGDAEEEEHSADCGCDECMASKDAAEKEEEEKAKDEIVREEPVIPPADRQKNAFDAASTMQLLNKFKPIIAKSGDKKSIAAFDVLYSGLRRALKPSTEAGKSSYAKFRTAATTLSTQAKDSKDTIGDLDPEWKPKVSRAEQSRIDQDKIYAEAGKKARSKK
jgi:hypothetical protein